MKFCKRTQYNDPETIFRQTLLTKKIRDGGGRRFDIRFNGPKANILKLRLGSCRLWSRQYEAVTSKAAI